MPFWLLAFVAVARWRHIHRWTQRLGLIPKGSLDPATFATGFADRVTASALQFAANLGQRLATTYRTDTRTIRPTSLAPLTPRPANLRPRLVLNPFGFLWIRHDSPLRHSDPELATKATDIVAISDHHGNVAHHK